MTLFLSQMEDDFNFFQIEDDLKKTQMKDDLNHFQIKDNLNILANGREPKIK